MKLTLIQLALCAALLTACGRKDEIKVYRISKAPLEESTSEPENTMPTNAPSPGAPAGVSAAPAVTSISAPKSWTAQPASQMRQASFLVKGDSGAIADISLVALGSSAGDLLENVNRWLSQLEQPSINDQQLAKIAQRISTAKGDVTIVDLAGLPKGADPEKDGRIIAAMVTTPGSTLFFKIRGNAELTESQKPEFIKWVAAVCNNQAENKPPASAAIAPQEAAEEQIRWKSPDGWKEVAPSAMRYASFATASQVDISVIPFAGEGGTDAGNVNRWRQQLGLEALDESTIAAQIVPLKTDKATFSTVDITGANTRTLAAWTRRDGQVWFFKATGPTTAVEKEKTNFIQFIQSVRF